MIMCQFEHGNTTSLRHVVVHALVVNNGAILLGKRAPHLVGGGQWGIPGGYVDRDETIYDAAKRELLEETGWKATPKGVLFINSSPKRPGDDRQNIAFDVVMIDPEKSGNHDDESTDIRWIPIGELASYEPFAFDHGASIKRFISYIENPISLMTID